MSSAKIEVISDLIDDGKYDEARAVLGTLEPGEARTKLEARLAKLDQRAATKAPAKAALPNRTRGTRIWRNVWGVLAILSVAWVCYGITAVSNVATSTAAQTATSAGKAGVAIGSGLGLVFYLCTGVPFLLVFLYAYSRAGAAIRSERQHRELMESMNKQ